MHPETKYNLPEDKKKDVQNDKAQQKKKEEETFEEPGKKYRVENAFEVNIILFSFLRAFRRRSETER